MSRSLSTVMQSVVALEAGTALVSFLEFNFGGGTVRLCTAPVDLSWNGQSWDGIGGTLTWDAPQEQAADQSGQGLRLTLSAVDQAVLAVLLQQQYLGRTMRIWQGHVALGENLLDNSQLDTVVSGWLGNPGGGGGTVVTRNQAVTPPFGRYVLQVDVPNTAGAGPYCRPSGGGHVAVTAGTDYTFSMYAYASGSAVGKQVRIVPHYWDGAAYSSSVTGPTVTLVHGWQRLSFARQCPAGYTGALVALYAPTAQGTWTFYVTGAQIERGAAAGPYTPTSGAAISGGTVVPSPVLIYSGFMNGGFELEETVDFERPTATISARVTSRLAALTNRRGIKTNLESHQRVALGDRFFQHVPQLASASIVWGSLPGWVNRFRGAGGLGAFPGVGGSGGYSPRRP